MGEVESTEIADFCINIKHLLGGHMTDIDLSTVPLSALTAEIKRRRDEWESAQKDLVGFGVSAPVAITKRSKHVSNPVSNPMKDAAVERWSQWASYKKDHPNASTKDYFAWRRKQKA